MRRGGRMLAAGAALSAVLVAAPAPAIADAALKSTDPKDGTTLTTLPNAVRFTFNEMLQDPFTTVKVTSGGTAVQVPAARTDGPVVWQPLPDTLPAGALTVTYRVVSADGHPVSGKINFRYDPPARTPPTQQPNTTADDGSPAANAAADPQSLAAASEGGSSPLLLFAGGAAVLGVLAVVLVGRLRHRNDTG
jgi:methionine-rich copper-binding protein CopC